MPQSPVKAARLTPGYIVCNFSCGRQNFNLKQMQKEKQ
jgi:hypothetical protein